MANRVYHLILLVMALSWPGMTLAGPVINILLSESGGIYQQTADSVARVLARNNRDWTVRPLTLDRYSASGSDLTIAVGTRALETALAVSGNKPVLSLLVPQLTYEKLAASSGLVSALYLDQPLSRQLQLMDLAIPSLKSAGVPLGPASRRFQAGLQRASRDSGVSVNSAVVGQGSELLSVLTDLAEDSQAFLLLPDPVVAQRGALQNFFLHTYRLRKPVLAYSAPLVQSGALLGLYATPEQLGEEAGYWVGESWTRGEFRLGMPRYPKRFTVGVNRTVARSLDISLPTEAQLTSQLEALQ